MGVLIIFLILVYHFLGEEQHPDAVKHLHQ